MRGTGFLLSLCLAAATAASAEGPQVAVQPSAIVLGNGNRVELRLANPGAKVHAVAAIGTLSPPDDPDADELRYTWTPPDIRYPTTAVILFWVGERSPQVTVVRIPLIGRTDLQVTTEPRATVRVALAGETFGPAQADSRGRVTVPIEVPPNVKRARVLAEVGGSKSEREVPIDVPPVNQLAVAITPDPIPKASDGVLIVAHAKSLSGVMLEVDPSGATTELIEADDDRALYRVIPQADATAAVVQVRVTGDAASKALAQADVREVEVPPEPELVNARFVPFGELGLFASGGANLGPSLAVGVGVPLPQLLPKLFAEAELSFRTASVSSNVSGLGVLDSRVVALPVNVGARYRILENGRFTVDGRAGIGFIFFNHTLSAPYQPTWSEAGLRPSAFAAITAGYKFKRLEPFAELRAAWGQVKTDHVDARLGGGVFSVGVRYEVP